ncbi:hypothetical protein PIN31009_00494 [Pandoraea iniqua]|uniref:Uncharacterized protein n=1 Tax=Pandoraea iniqua TaxID=2508288 RepID=A0A5E4SDY5_9BURK|nr:hypothetical protein PIN31009_00494 [Pandoraea iniqua]VVD72378.1 hypothetical protein PIN31115_00672 [Pandoraea iniqua]
MPEPGKSRQGVGVTPVARAVGGTGATSSQIERVGAHTGLRRTVAAKMQLSCNMTR